MTEKIISNIENREYVVGIIGLGYVGLPLLWTFHQAGFEVVGFDVDHQKIDCIKRGSPYIKHLGEAMMLELSQSDKCLATDDFTMIKDVGAIILCLPTPLDKHFEPDMSYVENTAKIVSRYLKKNHTVILESTTYPGTTEELLIPILEESGLKASKDFFVAYSPEREDPGNPKYSTAQIPKVVGGNCSSSLKIAETLYGTCISETVSVSNTRTAEAVKITENVFRAVNIALVNELKMVYRSMEIDVNEVLDAAATKPFGFMKFTPGPGLGGHCIPIDPFYLTWKAKEYGEYTKFIELAGEINTKMPSYVISIVSEALNTSKKAINGASVLVIGLSYKPDVDDIRESPTFKLMDLLSSKGASVDYYDDLVPEIPQTRDHSNWSGKKSIDWNRDIINAYDAVIISTNHSHLDYTQLGKWSKCIIDTRNAMSSVRLKNRSHIFKA